MISWASKQQQHNVSSTNTWLAWPSQSQGSFAIGDEKKRWGSESQLCYLYSYLIGLEFPGLFSQDQIS